ncbi:MAG: carbohydrate ABC transporter permease [Clostridia bacterium]|nr:carbohydrate ABC transporter permease [Clostridia bacterium]
MKRTNGEKIFGVFNGLFMIFMIVITLYPFVHILLASVSESSQLMAHRGVLLKPLGFNLNAYQLVFKNPNIYTGFKTTLIVLVGGTVINIVLTSIGAFLLSRRDWKFSGFLMIMVMITMYISGGMIPRYLLIYETLGMKDSLWALMLPTAVSTWNLIVMRTNFQQIPQGLEEAAKIDGANDLVVLFAVVLPLSKAIIAVMVLFYGVAHWNSWFDAMLFIRDRAKFPVQLIMREILISNSTDSMQSYGDSYNGVAESIKYATIIITTVPILIVYPFIQKYFVKGVMVGAIKG